MAVAHDSAPTDPVRTTQNSVQPHRNAAGLPYASRRETYGPPARGIIAASSASASDPHNVTRPIPIHTLMIGPNDRNGPATSPIFRKIPEPMIEPTTTITASNR